jgi:hypothetical protein
VIGNTVGKSSKYLGQSIHSVLGSRCNSSQASNTRHSWLEPEFFGLQWLAQPSDCMKDNNSQAYILDWCRTRQKQPNQSSYLAYLDIGIASDTSEWYSNKWSHDLHHLRHNS